LTRPRSPALDVFERPRKLLRSHNLCA
jgi:hypothetical protein